MSVNLNPESNKINTNSINNSNPGKTLQGRVIKEESRSSRSHDLLDRAGGLPLSSQAERKKIKMDSSRDAEESRSHKSHRISDSGHSSKRDTAASITSRRFSAPQEEPSRDIGSSHSQEKKKSLSTRDADKIIKSINAHKLYHGTDSKSQHSLQKNGFQVAQKSAGCETFLSKTRGTTSEDPDAKKYHYLTSDKMEAAKYAKMHRKPRIVRVIATRETNLEHDPKSESSTALRTDKAIQSSNVLPSKKRKLQAEQINKINAQLNLPQIDEKDKEMLDLIRDGILSSPTRDDDVIDSVKSFTQEEKETTAQVISHAKSKNIDTSNLAAGESMTISINLDDLDNLTFG